MNNVTENPYRKTMAIAEKLREYIENNKTATDASTAGTLFVRGSARAEVKRIIGEDNPIFEITESWNGGVIIVIHAVKSDGEQIVINTYEEAIKSRMNFILYRAFMREINIAFANESISMSFNSSRGNFSATECETLEKMLKIVSEIKWSKETLTEAISDYNADLYNLRSRMAESSQEQTTEKTNHGISKKIDEANEKVIDKDIIEAQIIVEQNKLQNSLTGRTWGWEVEAPNPGEFKTPAGVEAGTDGSVESYEEHDKDCECGCRDCTYHSCDCDNCDQYNEDPDHCGDSDCRSERSYEFRTIGGVTRVLHPGLKNLLDQISETEKNETAGTHIHVYARDLDAFQIGTVLGAYALTQKVWDVLSGRNVNEDARCKTYANLVPAEKVSYTLRNKKLSHVGKFNAVNTHNVATDRGTLEFRQMDCNFNFQRISFMAFMVRGLVEVAKRGAKLNEFMHITDINGLIKVYAKYGFKYESETESIDNPQGSRYNQSRQAPVCV